MIYRPYSGSGFGARCLAEKNYEKSSARLYVLHLTDCLHA